MRFSGVVCTIANRSIAVWRATPRCIQGSRFRVQGLGFSNFVVQGFRIRVQDWFRPDLNGASVQVVYLITCRRQCTSSLRPASTTCRRTLRLPPINRVPERLNPVHVPRSWRSGRALPRHFVLNPHI